MSTGFQGLGALWAARHSLVYLTDSSLLLWTLSWSPTLSLAQFLLPLVCLMASNLMLGPPSSPSAGCLLACLTSLQAYILTSVTPPHPQRCPQMKSPVWQDSEEDEAPLCLLPHYHSAVELSGASVHQSSHSRSSAGLHVFFLNLLPTFLFLCSILFPPPCSRVVSPRLEGTHILPCPGYCNQTP